MLVVYLQEDKKRRPWRDMMQEKTWDDPVVWRVSRVQTWEYTTAGTKHCFWYYIRVFSWLKKVVLLPSWVFFVNFLFFIVSFVVFYLSLCILVLHLLFLWMKPTTNALSSQTLHLTSCGLPVHEWMDTIIFKHNTHNKSFPWWMSDFCHHKNHHHPHKHTSYKHVLTTIMYPYIGRCFIVKSPTSGRQRETKGRSKSSPGSSSQEEEARLHDSWTKEETQGNVSLLHYDYSFDSIHFNHPFFLLVEFTVSGQITCCWAHRSPSSFLDNKKSNTTRKIEETNILKRDCKKPLWRHALCSQRLLFFRWWQWRVKLIQRLQDDRKKQINFFLFRSCVCISSLEQVLKSLETDSLFEPSIQRLLRSKAAEELKKEQERKAEERKRAITQRAGKPKSLEGNEATLQAVIRDYHKRILQLGLWLFH